MSGSRSASELLLPLATLAAGLLCLFCWWRSHAASAEAHQAKRQLVECRQLAARIEAARGGPTLAEENRRTEDELARQIEAWCRASGIAASEILRIEPITPGRVDNTSYLEQGARVQLRRLTLAQLAGFASRLAESEVKLSIGKLRLTAPRTEADSAAGAEAWGGEFDLTYFVYAPKSSR